MAFWSFNFLFVLFHDFMLNMIDMVFASEFYYGMSEL